MTLEIVVGALAAALCVALYGLYSARLRAAKYQGLEDVEAHRAKMLREAEAERARVLAEIDAQRTAALSDFDARRSSAERELEQLKSQGEAQRMRLEQEAQSKAAELRRLAAEITQQSSVLARLKADLQSVEEAVDIQSFGFYRAHYDFATADEYKTRAEEVRDEQKQLIKDEQAAHCPTSWTVDGSAAKGKKMVKEQVKLMLRAFNGECDAAISRVKYNNVQVLETRILKSFDAINDLGTSKQVTITTNYLNLKLAELRLVHEHREKQHQELEEQRRIKEQMRDEQKALEEIEKAQNEAAREEARYQTALEKARRELAEATGRQHEKLEGLVKKLETELSEAIDRKAKAIARAQLTRSGWVYVLSNVGSFGHGVYKIGMTRRLEPLERVKELSDASVPFVFDVHAMIFSEDAPSLENALHQEFASRRVNRVNLRREHFRVDLEDIRRAVAKHHGIVTFVTEPPAEEYWKTQALEKELSASAAR